MIDILENEIRRTHLINGYDPKWIIVGGFDPYASRPQTRPILRPELKHGDVVVLEPGMFVRVSTETRFMKRHFPYDRQVRQWKYEAEVGKTYTPTIEHDFSCAIGLMCDSLKNRGITVPEDEVYALILRHLPECDHDTFRVEPGEYVIMEVDKKDPSTFGHLAMRLVDGVIDMNAPQVRIPHSAYFSNHKTYTLTAIRNILQPDPCASN